MFLFRRMGTQRLLVVMNDTASLASSFDMSCSALSIPQVPWPIDQLKRKPRNRMAPMQGIFVFNCMSSKLARVFNV